MGMFVCGFGGSWFDHPFWRTRFVVRTTQQLDRIRHADVPFVVIDDAHGLGPEREAMAPAAASIVPPARPSRLRLALPARDRTRDFAQSVEQQRRREVKRMVSSARATMRGLFEDARMGRAVRVEDTAALVDDIADAVATSSGMVLDMVRLKNKDEYTFAHSVAVCALMIAVAQHLGKPAAVVRDYGQAGLLHDLGKIGVPEPVLNKPGRLTPEEYAQVRDHPEIGWRLLADCDAVCEIARDVCLHHHEKQDGTGYPSGLYGPAISEAAAFGGICDCYDALTSDRCYKAAWSPAEALAAMGSWQGHFHPRLLFIFMQSIGVFPAGMLVRLRSNRLGMVQPARRGDAGPRVTAFYDTRAREALPAEELVIDPAGARDSIIAPADPAEWGLGDWDALRDQLMGNPRQAARA